MDLSVKRKIETTLKFWNNILTGISWFKGVPNAFEMQFMEESV